MMGSNLLIRRTTRAFFAAAAAAAADEDEEDDEEEDEEEDDEEEEEEEEEEGIPSSSSSSSSSSRDRFCFNFANALVRRFSTLCNRSRLNCSCSRLYSIDFGIVSYPGMPASRAKLVGMEVRSGVSDDQ
jgi:hypothetical protein